MGYRYSTTRLSFGYHMPEMLHSPAPRAQHYESSLPTDQARCIRPMAYLWRQGILTLHARTPINTDLSRKLCAIAAAGEMPANGASNGSMHSLRAILNNPMAISPNTDPSRRVASGWEPHRKNTDRSRKNRR
jgi:hypothetical protein